jgi:signal transduction histidine kinase
MKPSLAKVPEDISLEDLGRATLQIVHDLKNQLNGLKLYATFLRKRLESTDGLQEERETLVKLIAGIDRAARDTNALVRYARPIELRRQPKTDLRQLLVDVVQEVSTTVLNGSTAIEIESENVSLPGDFDPAVLSEACKALTEQAMGERGADQNRPLIKVARIEEANLPTAIIEWRTAKFEEPRVGALYGNANLPAALAGRIIEAHGGRIEYASNTIRVWLPLAE